jgi:type IV secretory pathway VirB6-like protein
MKSLRQLLTILLAVFLSVTIISEPAFAAFTEITCDRTTGGATGGFFDPADITSANCEYDSAERVFTNIVCNFVIILNYVFSKFYCGLQYALNDIIIMVITLYVAVFGARLIIGVEDPSLGTVVTALLKIGAICLFTAGGTWGVSMIYDFFVSISIDGVNWVLNAINCQYTSITNNCIPNPVTGIITGGPTISSAFSSIDAKIYNAIAGVPDSNGNYRGGLFSGRSELIAFFIGLILVYPPLFVVALSLLGNMFSIFARSLVSFMMAITAIAFLISLSPIFLSFMLFNSTSRLFDSWIRFLISYSIQPMIVFGIMGLWVVISTDFVGFVNQLSSVMAFRNVNIGDNEAVERRDKGPLVTNVDRLLFCELEYSTEESSITMSVPPVFVPGGPKIGCCPLDYSNTPPDPPRCMPGGGTVDINDVFTVDLIAPEVMIRDSKFLYFLAYHLIALLVLVYAFSNMVKLAPKLAQELAGAQSSAPLGAGFSIHGGGLGSLMGGVSRGDWIRSLARKSGSSGRENFAEQSAKMVGRK